MKIVREGKEIELTEEELYTAYREQRSIMDVENIEANMECYLDKDEYEALKDNEDFIKDAADELRRLQDVCNMNYVHALNAAFEKIKIRYLKA